MPPKRTGTIVWHKDHFKARVRLADGSRPWIHFETEMTEPQAIAEAAEMSKVALAEKLGKGASTAGPRETVAEWGARWLEHRETKGFASASVDRGRLKTHVYKVIGRRPIAKVTRVELEALVEKLDARVSAGELSWRTARNAWALVTKMFSDAATGKVKALRVRKDNPAEGVRAPDRGVRKTKTYLYPVELLAVLSCPEVPLRWRRLFALAVYSYARAGELAALRWDAVDLARGVLHVHQSQDRFRERGKIKATKTGVARKVPVEPELLPLLRVLHQERIDDRVFPMPPGEVLSSRLRTYLLWAGVDRQELHANDATRKHLTFHDLRATGITWMAARGDDAWKIRSRAGHASISTTEGYVREVEAVGREAFGVVFPPLPPALIGPAIGLETERGTQNMNASGDLGLRPQRDSKPLRRGEQTGNQRKNAVSGDAGEAAQTPRTNPGTNRSGILGAREAAALRGDIGVAKALRRCQAHAERQVDEGAMLEELHRAAAGIPWARGRR